MQVSFQLLVKRSKCSSCANTGALHLFQVIDLVNIYGLIRLKVLGGRNTNDEITFYSFHLFLVEVQRNAGYIIAKQV